MPHSPFKPRWDLVERHLDEAEFLWGMWERSLVSPKYNLEGVALGPEERLLANIDGLVVNGPDVAPRLLVPALADGPSDRTSAAAAALLASPDLTAAAAVFDAWYELPAQRPALARALACADRPDLTALLRAQLDDSAHRAAAAELLVFRDEPLHATLDVLLASDDPRERAVALRAIPGEPDPAAHAGPVLAALANPELLDVAIAIGVRLDLGSAWARARERAQEPHGGESLLLLALRDDPADHKVLFSALGRPERCAAALWALGFLGSPEALDACAEYLDDRALGPLAGEAFSAVTGLDLRAAGLAASVDRRKLLEHTPPDDLPRPEPMAVLRWWTQRRGEFNAGQRYLGGSPRSLPALRAALEHGAMRRRPVHLLDLQLHAARHRPRLQPRAPTRRQRAQLAVLRDLPLA